MWFRGQKIVCVMQKEWHCLDGAMPRAITLPVHNGIYTIRHIVFEAVVKDTGETVYAFLLEEIKNPPVETAEGWMEPNFLSVDFRPLVERKTDISVFEKLLLPNERTGVKAMPAGPADVTLTPA